MTRPSAQSQAATAFTKRRVIYKYYVPEENEFQLDIPKQAQLLSVQMQGEHAQLWVLVDPDAEVERRNFRVFGTGQVVDAGQFDGYNHVDTWQSGEFAWHLFAARTFGVGQSG